VKLCSVFKLTTILECPTLSCETDGRSFQVNFDRTQESDPKVEGGCFFKCVITSS